MLLLEVKYLFREAPFLVESFQAIGMSFALQLNTHIHSLEIVGLIWFERRFFLVVWLSKKHTMYLKGTRLVKTSESSMWI